MKLITHIFTSLILSLYLFKLGIISQTEISIIIFGSILPDIIESMLSLKHRNIYIHNFIIPLLLFVYSIYFYPLFLIGLSYLHHLILDSQTVSGVYFLNKKIKGNLKTNNILHNAIVILLHLVFLIFLI